jgi:hypothetical protein
MMLLKVLLDIVWLVCLVLSFFLPVAVYMKDFSISVTSIAFDFVYLGMDAYVNVSFSDFQAHYCVIETASATLCSNLVLFKIAGLLYSILAALSAVCFLYTSLQGLVPRYKRLQARGVGYLTPMLYALAVLVYFIITIAFTEKPDVSLSSEYALSFDIGALVMLAAELLAIAEAVVHAWLDRPDPPVERPLETPLIEE